MTTITREQQKQILIDTANHVISRDNTSPYSENLRELARIALASLEAEPIGAFHIADQQVGGTSDYIKDGEWPIDNGVIDVYAVPPVQETGVYNDVFNIIGLLKKNEWAEHCTSTVLGSLLESEITRLVGKEQPASVVPPAIEPDYEVIKSILPTANPDEYACTIAADMWNACRAAMLQGGQPVSNRDELQVIGWLRSDYNSDDKRDPNAPLFMLGSNDPSETWGVKYIPLSGNSPVIPSGWVMVPKEPTQAMIKAWLSEVANFRGHAAGYKAALAAAPQREVK
ncbi:molecular chaperone DnaJ [Salmonella enterica]|nr:molecular chaperone DnaJ [Salmonella enterica]EBY1149339.1 molecular chaperone DnaJ [Salmonella enterica subsp. enterica serovar Newport]ECB2086319.1 molecular chaperone DnaJ [Salmonella enterica subsp. enterica serovar Newport]EEA4411453.1 molecular chaperone DnaJ [Salmonella enterica]